MSPEKDKVTRMIVLGPKAQLSQSELVGKLHMLELPLTIKSTCYGAVVHGEKEDVMEAVNQIRKLDPSNIFTKDRGFPPGDPRRCRAKRGAAREGFHQLEKEYELLEYVCDALENPEAVTLEEPEKITPDEFKKIAQECEK
ncbi:MULTISPECIES: methanogenesis marker 6 protein [Methanobacterium]|jgi:putative methanogenesis marker protein 6|uniref:Methanogenesis marker 6 protein n=1 Tax=Methanobacterium formicicum TaxID=2162 RepID=A0A089Z934_METFO|nr:MULTISPECIES: methanogenesis marker 6 protein [Methanobacterium]AIS31331.1 methanogenesis marker protein 6 [Methanobacterium formicicum]KUK75267.1 MAG: Putative methanogenesis marker protein 6 [Methanobacterium sp. 42_16]MBF4475569.1 methanogenesis marker 6 protein [Methanobacterium formicicum]MDD4810160.1 methanogenesis marker 6 protein [Methanobacterium formicicum]MDG3547824.1 methanogenesis marker 6 protein [Methanobacterium formicicum]